MHNNQHQKPRNERDTEALRTDVPGLTRTVVVNTDFALTLPGERLEGAEWKLAGHRDSLVVVSEGMGPLPSGHVEGRERTDIFTIRISEVGTFTITATLVQGTTAYETLQFPVVVVPAS